MAGSQDYVRHFSADYFQARERFRECAAKWGWRYQSVPIKAQGPRQEELTIDFARLGNDDAESLVCISSGLHGVEGFFGSAVQLALMERMRSLSHRNLSLLLIHALNPYGFAHLRRFDENNVDLNRNFLLKDESFSGVDPLYRHIVEMFRFDRAPSQFEIFRLKAARLIWRHGLPILMQSLPVGQYEYPKALFFGGKQPSDLQNLLRSHLPSWIGPARTVTHFDLHTGLGRFGTHRLLMDDGVSMNWFSKLLPGSLMEAVHERKTAYIARGTFAPWLARLFPDIAWYYTTFEFGTYRPTRIVHALFDEARGHFHLPFEHPRNRKYKSRLVEAFAPKSRWWRNRVVHDAVETIARTM